MHHETAAQCCVSSTHPAQAYGADCGLPLWCVSDLRDHHPVRFLYMWLCSVCRTGVGEAMQASECACLCVRGAASVWAHAGRQRAAFAGSSDGARGIDFGNGERY